MILKAFWQHKIDRFTHFFVEFCRDRRLRTFYEIHQKKFAPNVFEQC